jgi:AcrR family transcriptional regulator
MPDPHHTSPAPGPGARGRPRRGPGRPLAADSAATAAAILDAARASFARLGYDATTNKDIAEGAGIAAGTIYHYFASKPALFAAVGDEVGRSFFARLEQSAPDGAGLREQMRAMLGIVESLNDTDPSRLAFMAVWAIEIGRHDELRALVDGDGLEGPVQTYLARVEAAREAGELHSDADTLGVAALIASTLLGLSLLAEAGHGPDLVGPACRALDQLLGGELVARPEVTRSRRG